MAKTQKELFKEKLALIYEFNKFSPLFVKAADIEIEKNNLTKANDILNEGIQKFPMYPTAYLMLGKVHSLLGKYIEAEEYFVKGSEMIQSKETLQYYINNMEKLKRNESHFSKSRQVSFIKDNINKILQQELPLAESFPISNLVTPDKEEPDQKQIDDRLEELAKQISSAKIIADSVEVTQPIKEPVSDEPIIVSETLAKIYVSQGKFKEAVEVYKQLLQKQPEKIKVFQERIIEIETQIKDSLW